MSEREKYLGIAKNVAEYLYGRGCVEKVGITGSLADTIKDPNDIDLLVFAPNGYAIRFRENLGIHTKEAKEIPLKCLKLSQDEIHNFTNKFGQYPLDIMILSNNPDNELIKLSVSGLDPYFLFNVLNRALIFNYKSKMFERSEIYSQKTIDMINEAAFEVLKTRMNDEGYIQKIRNSFGLRKRRQIKETPIPSEDLI